MFLLGGSSARPLFSYKYRFVLVLIWYDISSTLGKYLVLILHLASQRCPDCNTLMDIYGDHASTCRTASGVIDKHNSIVNSLMVQMKSASMNNK
jgi:hypothetical protein